MPRLRRLTSKNVLAYLQDRAGHRFAPAQLADAFKRTTAEAREVLDELVMNELARSCVDGTTRKFYVPAAGDVVRTTERIVGKGELKGWEAGLRRFQALCMTARGTS